MCFEHHIGFLFSSLLVLGAAASTAHGQALMEDDIRDVFKSDAMTQAFGECVSGKPHPAGFDLVMLVEGSGRVTLVSVEPAASEEILSCLQAAVAGASFYPPPSPLKVIIPVVFSPGPSIEVKPASGPPEAAKKSPSVPGKNDPALKPPAPAPAPAVIKLEAAEAPKGAAMPEEKTVRACVSGSCFKDDPVWRGGSYRMAAGATLAAFGELALAISIGYLAKVRSEQGETDCDRYGFCSPSSSLPAPEHVGAEYGLLATSLALKYVAVGLLAMAGNYHYAAVSAAGVKKGRGARSAGFIFLLLSGALTQISLMVIPASVEATTALLYTASFLQSFAAACFLGWDIALRGQVRALGSVEKALVPMPSYAYDPKSGTHAISVAWKF
jgi:hypothetical protein